MLLLLSLIPASTYSLHLIPFVFYRSRLTCFELDGCCYLCKTVVLARMITIITDFICTIIFPCQFLPLSQCTFYFLLVPILCVSPEYQAGTATGLLLLNFPFISLINESSPPISTRPTLPAASKYPRPSHASRTCSPLTGDSVTGCPCELFRWRL